MRVDESQLMSLLFVSLLRSVITMQIKHPRFRDTFLIIGAVFVTILYILTDPNLHILKNMPFGASTLVLLTTLLKSVWYVGFLYVSIRAILDRIDLEQLFENADKTPEGSARVLIAISIMMVAIAIVIYAAVMSN